MAHNNIITLYCINEEKLLCAGCMYQSSNHKGHKVIPMGKGDDIIKNHIKNSIVELEELTKICNKNIETASLNILNAEKEYPVLMEKIHNFYLDMHQLLIDRKNSQLKLLSDAWSRLRYENSTLKL